MKANDKANSVEELLRGIRAGEQKAFPALLALYEPLIRAEVARCTVGMDASRVEDFRQEALLALHRAALNFDFSQCEVEFGLYAKICIARALTSLLRRLHRNNEVSVPDVRSDDGSDDNGDPARFVIEQEDLEALHARIRKLLSPFENRVCDLYTAGHSTAEIGRILGKKQHSIENAVYRIRQKLRKKLR